MNDIQPGSQIVEYTEKGAIFSKGQNLSLEEFRKEIGQLARINRISQFCLGDMINAANAQHGKKYDDWIEITGLSYGTLANICSVCNNVEISRRRESLDFSTHAEVASIKDETKREKILDLAEKHHLNRKDLRLTIKRGSLYTQRDAQREKELRDKQGDGNQGQEPHSLTLAKLTRWAEDAEQEHGMVDTWDRGVQAQLRQEFGTLYEFMQRLFA